MAGGVWIGGAVRSVPDYAAGWPVLVIGVLAIVSAVAYTGRPYPLGYHGLGEVFVFLFFGLAAVGRNLFCPHPHHQRGSAGGLHPDRLSGGGDFLVVNNLRDIPTDRLTGKRTLAVRFGEAWTRAEYVSLLAARPSSVLVLGVSGSAAGVDRTELAVAAAGDPAGAQCLPEQGRALNRVRPAPGSWSWSFHCSSRWGW